MTETAGIGEQKILGLEFSDREEEGSAVLAVALVPDLAVVVFDDLLGDSQADTCTIIYIICMQPFEHLEYLFCKLLRDTYAIVRYCELITVF